MRLQLRTRVQMVWKRRLPRRVWMEREQWLPLLLLVGWLISTVSD